MELFRISYMNGGLVYIQPDTIAAIQYKPEVNDGHVDVLLKSGKCYAVTGCSKDSALDYIRQWRDKLDKNAGGGSDLQDIKEILGDTNET